MAQRRMIDRDIVFSNRFLSMNNASLALYLKMLVSADDDGFVDNVMLYLKRKSGLNELIANGFIYRFSTGAVLLRHWFVHNRIRKDTYKQTIMQAEKALVTLGSDNIYYLDPVTQTTQSGTVVVPQVSIGKVSKGKGREAEVSIGEDSKAEERQAQEREAEEAGNAAVTASASGGSPSAEKDADFISFWNAYPRKEDQEDAYKAFQSTDAPLQTLLKAVSVQRLSDQWVNDGGQYIPKPANWLRKRLWEARIDPPPNMGVKEYTLGEAELQSIRRALAEG